MDSGNIYIYIGIIGFILSWFINKEKTKKAGFVFLKIAISVLPVILFIFVLMGLVQVFLPKDTIALFLGGSSGVFSIFLGELLGSVSLIQPGAVFPFAGYLHDNGANFGAIYTFVMAAILIGFVTIPLEIKMFGKRFTFVRNGLSFLAVFIIGLIFKAVM
ncbi:permease [Helicovermis profundi]|uniref:Permease n=1 Tax=Helicovermis profundi TaxID=3065157 RepID=A0AAU9E4V3_9FIRM|nr:hypothetical protein HLPR_19800 [Clostridia bacterium S502]